MQIRYSDFDECRSSSIDSVLRIRIRNSVLFDLWIWDQGKVLFRIPDRTHISESLLAIFWLQIINFLVNWSNLSLQSVLYLSKNINNFQFCEIYSHCLVALAKVNWRNLYFSNWWILVSWIPDPLLSYLITHTEIYYLKSDLEPCRERRSSQKLSGGSHTVHTAWPRLFFLNKNMLS